METIALTLKKNEERVFPIVWINDDETEYKINITLSGEGANVIIAGIFLGTGSKKVVCNTTVRHRGKKTKSLTTLRGVFFDNSSLSNDGMVRIDNGAKGSDGYFSSKILLFNDAKGRSVPSLEIDENDLKAGHASTVGRPDPNHLFYLQSRGLSESEAIKLIVSGYFNPVLSYLSKDQRRDAEERIHQTLQQLYEIQKS